MWECQKYIIFQKKLTLIYRKTLMARMAKKILPVTLKIKLFNISIYVY